MMHAKGLNNIGFIWQAKASAIDGTESETLPSFDGCGLSVNSINHDIIQFDEGVMRQVLSSLKEGRFSDCLRSIVRGNNHREKLIQFDLVRMLSEVQQIQNQ